MKTIFEDADAFEWENTHEGLIPGDIIQKAKDDPSDVASRVAEVMDAQDQEILGEFYAGDVQGAHGPVGLYIYTMEDDDWVYVAHFIYEVEYQCFLFRHKKKYK